MLLIGDSISIGYTLPTRKLLEGKANVHRIATNGGPTIKGLQMIDDYEKNLTRLVVRLKKTGAKLIWCSTTPVPEGAGRRTPGDELEYNRIDAAKHMARFKVAHLQARSASKWIFSETAMAVGSTRSPLRACYSPGKT